MSNNDLMQVVQHLVNGDKDNATSVLSTYMTNKTSTIINSMNSDNDNADSTESDKT